MNEFGLGRYSDLRLAVEFYKKSSEKFNNCKAMNELGKMEEKKYEETNVIFIGIP